MKNTDMYIDLPNILNADQLASTLGVSRARAYQLLNTADFPTLKIGKRKLVLHISATLEHRIRRI